MQRQNSPVKIASPKPNSTEHTHQISFPNFVQILCHKRFRGVETEREMIWGVKFNKKINYCVPQNF